MQRKMSDIGEVSSELTEARAKRREPQPLPLNCPWHGLCYEKGCAIWDKDGQRCALLEIAVNSRRI